VDSLVDFKTMMRDGSIAVPSKSKTRDKRDEKMKIFFGIRGYKSGIYKENGKQANVQ